MRTRFEASHAIKRLPAATTKLRLTLAAHYIVQVNPIHLRVVMRKGMCKWCERINFHNALILNRQLAAQSCRAHVPADLIRGLVVLL